MRPHSTNLYNYMNGNLDVVQADLYTFKLIDGEVFRYSGYTKDLTLPAIAFQPGSLNFGSTLTFPVGPLFGRSKIKDKVGMEATELTLEVLAGPNDLIGSFPFAAAVRFGLFDGATFELDRFFMPVGGEGYLGPLDTSLGTITWFFGRIADVTIGRSKVTMQIKSLLDILSIHQLPRRMYASACGHVFGDVGCGYDRQLGKNALGTSTGFGAIAIAATAGSSQAVVVITTSGASPHYTQGTIQATSGLNNGAIRTIGGLNGTGQQFFLFKPFLYPVNPGDTFSILPGCDHTTTTCNGTFQNILRYGGMPYIPPPELAF